jgi:chemotaxis signal transduction protein
MSISNTIKINNQINNQDHINSSEIILDPLDYLIPPNNRYIVAKVGDHSVTFPDVLVSEIIILDRKAIVTLPFYKNMVIGVTHHQASIMPLLLLRLILGENRSLITESLTVVRLSKAADGLSDQNLGGVGIIVDRVSGSLTTNEYQGRGGSNLDPNRQKSQKVLQTVANIKENEYTPIEIILSSIPTHTWQPQRW